MLLDRTCLLNTTHNISHRPYRRVLHSNDRLDERYVQHNVVIACLPEGQTGTNSAAAVAVQMKSTLSSTWFGPMVGIGGGVPSEDADVRLGDVVVSKPPSSSAPRRA
jgi:hypothetical protein